MFAIPGMKLNLKSNKFANASTEVYKNIFNYYFSNKKKIIFIMALDARVVHTFNCYRRENGRQHTVQDKARQH